MFNLFKAYRVRRNRHIADVYQNQKNPEFYLKMERDLRWQPVKDILGCFALIALLLVFVKVWFILEGFSIRW